MFLAALGKRDAETAVDGTLVLSGQDRPQVRRQAVAVTWKSMAAGVALTILALGIAALIR